MGKTRNRTKQSVWGRGKLLLFRIEACIRGIWRFGLPVLNQPKPHLPHRKPSVRSGFQTGPWGRDWQAITQPMQPSKRCAALGMARTVRQGLLVGEAAPLSLWAMQMAPRNPPTPAERLGWAGVGSRAGVFGVRADTKTEPRRSRTFRILSPRVRQVGLFFFFFRSSDLLLALRRHRDWRRRDDWNPSATNPPCRIDISSSRGSGRAMIRKV